MERWLPIPDFEGLYEVSCLGRVRSLYFEPPRISKQGTDSNGYPIVMLSKCGKRKPFTVLVCRAFHGESRPVHREVAHLDGNKANPRADNLGWVSKIENESHKRAHGTRHFGEASTSSKLTEATAEEIWATLCRSAGRGQAALARRLRITVSAVRDVWRGQSWRHVTGRPRRVNTKGIAQNGGA